MNETAYSSRYRFVIGGFVVWAQFTPGLSILAVAPILPRITDEYGLTHATASLLIGVVAIVQALSSIPAGVIVGRIGVWRTYSISWPLMGTAVLSAVAPGFYTLLALRIVLGVGMAGILPAAGPLIMQWFRARERPVVSGFCQAGLSLGTMVAVASAVPLADVIGWQRALGLFGAVGLAGALAWIVWGKIQGGPGKKTQQRLERDVRCHSTRESALSLAAVLFSPHPKLVVMQPPVRRQGHNGTSYVGLWLVVRAKPLCHVPDGFWRGSLTIPTSLKQ